MADNIDKPNVVDTRLFGDHPINRLAHLTDEDFLRYVKSLPVSTLRQKLRGPLAKQFSDAVDSAAKRVADKAAKEQARGR